MEGGDPQAEDFAAVLYAEPGALGLISNIVAGLLVAVENMQNGPFSSTALTLSGVHLIVVGGLLQLIAGLLSFRRWDHLTGTAFFVFASLWTAMGVNRILAGQGVADVEVLRMGTLPGMIGFMAVALILCICAVTLNFILPPVLVALMMTLVFESVGAFYDWGRRVAAGFELFIVITSVYAVVVMMLKGVSQRYILPGFGNAPYDPLLIRTKAAPAVQNEKKKITKYAEPMGLGYLGNVVPAAVLAFHHLGYFNDFRPAIAMFIFCAVCQVLASFYSFLRHDFYHAFSFVLYSIFWNSRAILQLLISLGFQQVFDSRVNFFGQWTLIILIGVLTFVAASHSKVVFVFNVFFFITAVLSVDHIPVNAHNFTFGVTSAILGLLSLYVGMSALENSIAEKAAMYIGREVIPAEKLKKSLAQFFGTYKEKDVKNAYMEDDVIDEKIVDSLVFCGSSISLMALSAMEATNAILPVPWLMVSGVFVHAFAARLAYASGSLSKAYSSLVLAIFYGVWTALLLNNNLAFALRPLSLGVLCLFAVVMVMTPTFTRVWIPFSALLELCIITQVLVTFGVCPRWMLLVTSLFAAIVSLYAACAEMINTILMYHVVPVGEPLVKDQSTSQEQVEPPCPLFTSRRSSALQKVAALLDQGSVMGVPTDTVYALGASCKHPASIKRIYMVKGRPAEKPICLCLSSLDQLAEVHPPFSDLLWNFMRRCYPGGISCVVPKGEWMKRLGLGEAVDYVGTKESICIRVPDSSALAYLVSCSGPIALTSANPSGEEDSTHHDMVINSLGHKLDGVVCDGTSNELVASTVVNCLKIDQGVISYFRIGCTPKEIVDAHFEAAKAEIAARPSKITMNEKLS